MYYISSIKHEMKLQYTCTITQKKQSNSMTDLNHKPYTKPTDYN